MLEMVNNQQTPSCWPSWPHVILLWIRSHEKACDWLVDTWGFMNGLPCVVRDWQLRGLQCRQLTAVCTQKTEVRMTGFSDTLWSQTGSIHIIINRISMIILTLNIKRMTWDYLTRLLEVLEVMFCLSISIFINGLFDLQEGQRSVLRPNSLVSYWWLVSAGLAAHLGADSLKYLKNKNLVLWRKLRKAAIHQKIS